MNNLDEAFERMEQKKKNGCKVLECKTIDENIKLRRENIRLRKIADKLADILSDYKYEKIICMKTDCEYIEIQNGGKCIGDKECILDWARKEVEKDE